jgi:hypothetical protein
MLSFYRKLPVALIVWAGWVPLLAQDPKPDLNSRPSLEFPASLQGKVVAGSTPVGAEVRARLAMATLMEGVVIPQDALIFGHVEQSVAKSNDAPAILKIKFESARWKKGSTPLTLYLAGCYYPVEFRSPADNPSGLHGEVGLTMGGAPPDTFPRAGGGMPNSGGLSTMDASGQGTYPDPRPSVTVSEVAKHWVRMEKVETVVAPDGSLQITSHEKTLKLDKGTTYLLRNASAPQAK